MTRGVAGVYLKREFLVVSAVNLIHRVGAVVLLRMLQEAPVAREIAQSRAVLPVANLWDIILL